MLLRYRGGEGMLAWVFHRISGVAIWAFVVFHVIDIYLVGGAPDAYDEILKVYASLPGRIEHEVEDQVVGDRQDEQGQPGQPHEVPDRELGPAAGGPRTSGARVEGHRATGGTGAARTRAP